MHFNYTRLDGKPEANPDVLEENQFVRQRHPSGISLCHRVVNLRQQFWGFITV